MSQRPSQPPSPDHAPEYPATTSTVVFLVATALVVLTQLYLAIPLIAPVGRGLGGDATLALSTAFSLCYASGFLIWGPISDRYGRKKILLCGMTLLILTTTCCAMAPNLPTLGVLRGLQGFSAASFAPIALAYLAESLPITRRPTAIGAMSTAFLVAGIVGQVFAAAINLTFATWRAVFLSSTILLILCFLSLIPARRMVEIPHATTTGSMRQSFVVVGQIVARPRTQFLCLAHVTVLMSFVAMYSALGPHLGSIGMSQSQLIWLRLAGLPSMCVALVIGRIAARVPMGTIARVSFIVAALGLLLEGLLSATLWGIIVASLVFVAGIAMAVPTMITLFGQASAPYRAGGMAINGAVLFIGASLGPLVARLPVGFSTLMWALAGILLLACGCVVVFQRLSPPRRAVTANQP